MRIGPLHPSIHNTDDRTGPISFYAACMGDTLASELGMLAAAQPRMLSTFRVVPPGTNGGVTWWGTLMSLAGGAFVGSVALLDLFLEDKLCLAAEPRSAAQLLLFATLAGGLGSAVRAMVTLCA